MRINKKLTIFFDIGNVFVYPDGETIANVLSKIEGLVINPLKAENAFLLADKDLYLSSNDKNSNQSFVELWGIYTNIDSTLINKAWRYLGDETQHRYWNKVDQYSSSLLLSIKNMGFKVGAISNTDGKLVEDLREFNLLEFFDVIIDSKIEGIEKPDVRLYKLAAQRLSVDISESIYVGDTIPELDGALESGMKDVILYDPLNIYSEVSKYKKANSLKDLEEMLTLQEITL